MNLQTNVISQTKTLFYFEYEFFPGLIDSVGSLSSKYHGFDFQGALPVPKVRLQITFVTAHSLVRDTALKHTQTTSPKPNANDT